MIYLYEVSESKLIVCFSTGSESKHFLHSIKNAYDWLLLPNIIEILGNPKYDYILLSGHSNGMDEATLISLLLMHQ